jgi:hypothetical protein
VVFFIQQNRELGMMKKMLVLVMALSLVASVAMAQGEKTSSSNIGLRAGLSLSPDQVHVGAHMNMGQIVGPLRLVPNVEIGFGESITMICLNGDFVYDFPDTPFSVGGEIGLNYAKYDFGDYSSIPGLEIDDSTTDLGLSILADYNLVLSNGKTLLLEAKLGLTDSADFKFTAGYNFF